MKKIVLLALAVAGVLLVCDSHTAQAGNRKLNSRRGYRFARTMPWHGGYYHTNYGQPLALVVPPTAHMQVHWGWGVAQSGTQPIYHQFRRSYPGPDAGMGSNGMLRPTPNWPSHTSQFGVYPVRGPWGGPPPRH